MVAASLLVLGMAGLIQFGLLLAFSTGSNEDENGRSVISTRRNLGTVAVMVAAVVWFWLWHLDLTEPMKVVMTQASIRGSCRCPRNPERRSYGSPTTRS